MSSTDNVDDNLDSAASLVRQAVAEGASLVSLPENFALMPLAPQDLVQCAWDREQEIDTYLAELARAEGVILLAGSFPARSPDSDRIYGSCRAYGGDGARLARYDKMHLFDVNVGDGQRYQESDYTYPGDSIQCVDTPVARIGLSICYDMRFPELYRCLTDMGAVLFNIPSAFTVPTGIAHWEVLLRARAIENLAFVMAPAQWGRHTSGRETFGHSMIIDPWGRILACRESGVGVCLTEIELNQVAQVRSRFPALSHRRLSKQEHGENE